MVFPEKAGSISIVGLGGVGSRVAEGLVRLGVGQRESPLALYDFDTFEKKNIKNQLVTLRYVGYPKVTAIGEQLIDINPDIRVSAHMDKVMRGMCLNTDVVCLCLDSMQSRREIVEHCLGANVRCVIETRMDSAVGWSHCFDPRNQTHRECWWINWYPEHETDNKAGCQGPSPVISAIFGTASLALKQFEAYLDNNCSAWGITNYVYTDFNHGYTKTEVWPT